jgi:hypothetical protein
VAWFILAASVVEGGKRCKIWMGFLLVVLAQFLVKISSFFTLIMVTLREEGLFSLAIGS